MAATKTDAFILRTRDWRDTSLLGEFYTREHGKIRGVVRGIRDARARYGSTLEPFSLNEILFYKRRRGGDLHQVTQVELLDLYTEVREDLERLSYASYFAELVDQLVEVEDPNVEIFDLLRDTLELMRRGASPRRAARIFEVKLFEALGLMPEIKRCVSCRAEAPDPAYFNVALGGIRCRPCSLEGAEGPPGQEHSQTLAMGMPVSKGSLAFLEHVRRAPVADLQQVKVSAEVGAEVGRTLRRFVDFHLTGKLKTLVFLDKMGFSG